VDGGEINLRPKSFEALRYLVENPGRLIPRDEFIKAVWPNTTVTDESLTNCIGDVRRAIGDRHQTIVKTMPRRGYIFTAEVTAEGFVDGRLGPRTPEHTRPDKPSIAILAFTNMSGDPSQEYFCDGITDDIITELSRFSELFVIARNSSFQFKARGSDVRQVGRDLGARYVLEGIIRREGERVRITAQLIDAVTGTHRWADRYDRLLSDVFAVQDEVARTIVSVLAVHVSKAEAERTLNKPPMTWEAYDYYIRAAGIFAAYLSSFRVEELYETRRLLEHSLRIDRNYARAYTLLSNTYTTAWLNPLDADCLNPGVLERACQLARKAVQLEPSLPQARAELGYVSVRRHDYDTAIVEFEKAIALNPNFMDWRFVIVLVYCGQAMRALDVAAAHMRLDPFCPPLVPGWLGFANYMLKRYSEALPPLRELVSRAPNQRGGHLWLAATYARLGQMDKARAAAAEVLRIHPAWTIERAGKPINGFKLPQDAEHYFDGLRKAGLPG
jgi:adenylate cyclase